MGHHSRERGADDFVRRDRLHHLLYEELFATLRDEAADPRLVRVRFTSVQLSKDHSTLRVGWVVLAPGRDARVAAADALERSSGFFARRAFDAVALRRAPKLVFVCLGEALPE